MRQTAFICPIYDSRNHFEYGVGLLNSKVHYQIESDLYFIFSNIEQKNKFSNMLNSQIISESKFLILPEEEREFKSQVTIKKFFGLKELMSRYEYMATIDSESKFINNADYFVVFDNMWKNNDMLKANISPRGYTIMRSCFKSLGLYDNKILKKQTNNYKYNVWFNDIPIYKCDILEEFFQWLSSLETDDYKNNWNCFEYYIFMAFLIIEKGFQLRKYELTSLGGIMEYLYVFDEEEQKRILDIIKPHWTSIDNSITDDITIRFHLDRDKEDELYCSKDFQKEIRIVKKKRIKCLIKDALGME